MYTSTDKRGMNCGHMHTPIHCFQNNKTSEREISRKFIDTTRLPALSELHPPLPSLVLLPIPLHNRRAKVLYERLHLLLQCTVAGGPASKSDRLVQDAR